MHSTKVILVHRATLFNKKLSSRRDSAQLRLLLLSKWFKVTDFDANRKPIRDFIIVNNTKLHCISHRFPIIAQCWSNYRFWQGMPRFNVFILCNLCEYRHKSYITNTRFFVLHSYRWQLIVLV